LLKAYVKGSCQEARGNGPTEVFCVALTMRLKGSGMR